MNVRIYAVPLRCSDSSLSVNKSERYKAMSPATVTVTVAYASVSLSNHGQSGEIGSTVQLRCHGPVSNVES